MSVTPSLPLALTMGEPAGIGPDLIAQLAGLAKQRQLPPIVVVGDQAVISERCAALGIGGASFVVVTESTDIPTALANSTKPVVVLDAVTCPAAIVPGRPDQRNAKAVVGAIDIATALIKNGLARAVVTNPIQKETLYQAGFSHPGHTEYLAHLASGLFDCPCRPVMLIHTPALMTVPVTIHIPLAAVPDQLTEELIAETCRITAQDLTRLLGLARPRLAVAGLNPHAGEGGSIGTEDGDVIAPALEKLRAEGLDVTGPLPADTMFHEAARTRYDVAICMYHDQALIPAKTLGFDDGVNVTLGLPFIRTSPDHGTALDIAGTGQAKPDSLLAAIDLASRMAEHKAKAAA